MIVIGSLFDLFEIRSQGIFGNFLKIDVDCRVNPVAFVDCAVPSDGCDHLLTNVIDCVSLPLRILPAPHNNFLASCVGALFAIDKANLAHPIERVVARFTRGRPVCPWRQSVWALDQACEGGAFCQRHFTGWFAKVPPRRCFRSVQAGAEIDPVQI